MTDFIPDNMPEESIEETRRRKLEQFRRTYDQDAIRGAYDVDSENFVLENPVPPYSDEGNYDQGAPLAGKDNAGAASAVSFHSDDTPLKRRRKSEEINSFSDSDTKRRIERDSKKALKQQKKEEKRNEKAKAKRNRRVFKWVWLAMIVMVSVMIAQFVIVGMNDMLAVGRSESVRTVQISVPSQPTIDTIADILYDNGVIARPTFFKLYTRLTSSESGFRQGEFMLDTDKDYEAIINTLQSNESRTDFEVVQITEGMNTWEIAKLLHEMKVINDEDKFLAMCNSDIFDEEYPFLKEATVGDVQYMTADGRKYADAYKLEGYLFPDTYYFYKGDDEKNLKSIIGKMLDNYEDKIILSKDKYFANSKRVSLQTELEKTGYSMHEILTIASIIQAEAATKKDMYVISSVLHNRLEKGATYGVSRLNCDCTVYYPWREAEDVPDALRGSYTSRYNTNNFNGLPIGPICNPGIEAIKAAINPRAALDTALRAGEDDYTEYLFFCHDSDGTPHYARTLEEHEEHLRNLT